MKAILSLCLVAVAAVTFAAGDSISPELFTHYQQLNNAETRLAEWKDSDETLQLKLAQLAEINKSRKRFRRQPVQLDILASRVANKMAHEAATNSYTGHWNFAGEKPYHRYAFAGGVDHVGENAYGYWSSRAIEEGNSNISKLMQQGHKAFMTERPPNDGHKKQVLDKHHNYVGIGFHLADNYFSYYEEFVDRYYTFSDVPKQVKAGERFEIGVKPQDGQYLYYVQTYYDKPLKPKTRKKIMRRHSYADYGKDAGSINPWEVNALRQGDEYRIPFKFDKPGLYYIHIYQHKKAVTKPSRGSTRGKLQASGIVVEVLD